MTSLCRKLRAHTDDQQVPLLVLRVRELARSAVQDAAAVDPSVVSHPAGFTPDVALINWYGSSAKMGMHVDRDERSPALGRASPDWWGW